MKHKFNLSTKLRAIEMAEETGNKRKTARKFRVDPTQIRTSLKAANWRREQYNLLKSGKRLPSPKRKDVLNWLEEICDLFPVEIVKNSFTESGYYFEDGIDWNAEIGSKSDDDD